jgi:drug/metabolite transporter (DMT)-like permease
MNKRLAAILQGLFVVFLWATSWVLIKIGLRTMPPLTFAGLRYFIAFILLLAVLLLRKERMEVRILPKSTWWHLIVLGLVYYAITQGISFVALAYLPAVTVNLLWSFTSVATALLGIAWLSEIPTLLQWGGMLLALFGALIFFSPIAFPGNQMIGVIASLVGLVANAVSSIMGRKINRPNEISPLVVTTISMGVGSIILLVTGLCLEGFPVIDWTGWLVIVWLAIVNTAFAFTLWNHTLRTLTAMESSVINNTMIIWVPVLAVLFLGETIGIRGVIGLVLVGVGTLIVQLHRTHKHPQTAGKP